MLAPIRVNMTITQLQVSYHHSGYHYITGTWQSGDGVTTENGPIKTKQSEK